MNRRINGGRPCYLLPAFNCADQTQRLDLTSCETRAEWRGNFYGRAPRLVVDRHGACWGSASAMDGTKVKGAGQTY